MQILLCIRLFHNTSQWKSVLFPRRWWGTIVSNTLWSAFSKRAQLIPVFDSCQHQIPDRYRKALQEATPLCAERSFLPRPLAVTGWHKPQNIVYIQQIQFLVCMLFSIHNSFLHASQRTNITREYSWLSFIFGSRITTKFMQLGQCFHWLWCTFRFQEVNLYVHQLSERYLTESFIAGDITCAFISSKENLLK